MYLRIIHRGNELLNLPVEISAHVADIKPIIANALNLSSKDIILTVNGTYLEDNRKLEEYPIKEFGSLQLHLPIKCRNMVTVRVVLSSDEVHLIPLFSDSTVADLKSEIGKRTSQQACDLQNAYLVYSHYILEDSRTLEDYGITDNAGIAVVRTLNDEKIKPSSSYTRSDNFKEDSATMSSSGMITVHFLTENGDPFTLLLDPNKPITSVSKNIELRTGIPVNQQRFIMSGVKVDPEKTPQELEMQEGESVYLNDKDIRGIYPSLKKERNHKMNVIFDLGRRKIRMSCPDDYTVKEVIRDLQTDQLINGQKIDLFYNNKRLDPRKRLYEYGITHESIVNVGVHFQ